VLLVGPCHQESSSATLLLFSSVRVYVTDSETFMEKGGGLSARHDNAGNCTRSLWSVRHDVITVIPTRSPVV